MNKEMTTWKKLIDFPNYSVSDTGLVRADNYLKTGKAKELKQQTKRGYKSVTIADKNGKLVQITVHRLIAMTFLPNPENKPQVNHKDRNRANNNLDNLEWCTAFENMQHYEKTRTTPIFNQRIVLDTKTGIFYDSCAEAERLLGWKKNVLSQYLNGRAKNNTSLMYV